MYDELDDVRMRLEGTMVLYGGQPVYVEGVDANNFLSCIDPFAMDEPPKRYPVTDEAFEFRDIPLGYTNYNGQVASYSSRTANRQYKQGLNARNVKLGAGFRGRFNEAENLRQVARLITGSSLRTFQDCVENKRYRKLAFSRNFALGRDGQIFYREMPVGLYDERMGAMFHKGLQILKLNFDEEVRNAV